MTNFSIKDYDEEALIKMFEITKRQLIEKLNDKLVQLDSFKPSDCCSLSAYQFEELKRAGGLEWNQLSAIVNRLVARRKMKELETVVFSDKSEDDGKRNAKS